MIYTKFTSRGRPFFVGMIDTENVSVLHFLIIFF